METSGILAEAARLRARKEDIVDVDEERVKLVVFSLGGDLFAFYGSDVKEILAPMRIFPVPGSPEHILGVINVRGDIESVVSINGFFGLPQAEPSPRSRIPIAEKGGIRSGIMVDGVEDVVDFPVDSIRPPIATLDRSWRDLVSGETALGDASVTLLDLGEILRRLAP